MCEKAGGEMAAYGAFKETSCGGISSSYNTL